MHYQHICASHATQIQLNEFSALELWNRSMHQGISTYAHCRWDCASQYLSAAMEIAIIRLSSTKNVQFNSLHLLKPVEFLLEIFIYQDAYKRAVELLEATAKIIDMHERENFNVVALALHRFGEKLQQSLESWQCVKERLPIKNQLLQRCHEVSRPERSALH